MASDIVRKHTSEMRASEGALSNEWGSANTVGVQVNARPPPPLLVHSSSEQMNEIYARAQQQLCAVPVLCCAALSFSLYAHLALAPSHHYPAKGPTTRLSNRACANDQFDFQ